VELRGGDQVFRWWKRRKAWSVRSEVQSGNPEQPTCQHVPPNNDRKTTQIAALNEWVAGPE